MPPASARPPRRRRRAARALRGRLVRVGVSVGGRARARSSSC